MLAPNGTFTVYDVPANNYVVHIKGKKWLAANVNVNTMGGNAPLTATLKAGDANDDNSVDVFDLDPLIQAFNTAPGDTEWDVDADFNCDDSVDVFDLDLLIRNFNVEGAL